MVSRWFQMLVLGLAAVLAAGCATVREVDSQVQSWSTLRALPVPPTYRLEKLPSQQSTDKAFASIEALAHQALQRAGLQRDDAAARLAVQVSVRASQALPDWPHYPPLWGWGPGWGGRYPLRAGMLLRIDRLVEFDDFFWVLDYKSSRDDTARLGEYRNQVADYCRAVADVFPGKAVRGALIFGDASLLEVC